jgi:hypothetical protein
METVTSTPYFVASLFERTLSSNSDSVDPAKM